MSPDSMTTLGSDVVVMTVAEVDVAALLDVEDVVVLGRVEEVLRDVARVVVTVVVVLAVVTVEVVVVVVLVALVLDEVSMDVEGTIVVVATAASSMQ